MAVSAGFLLAGSALAAAYAPGTMMTGTQETAPANMQKMAGYMGKLQAGTLTATEQQDMYKIMTTPVNFPVMMNPLNAPTTWNRPMMYPGAMGFGSFGANGLQGTWYELMFILTVAMVWVVLLLLISLLFRKLKDHSHK